MPNNLPSLVDIKNMTETTRTLVFWEGLQTTWNKVIALEEHQKEMDIDVIKHDRLLITGNGDKPLMERMRNVENFQTNFQYWSKFVGGALILNFIGFATGIVIALVRFLPVLERLANKP